MLAECWSFVTLCRLISLAARPWCSGQRLPCRWSWKTAVLVCLSLGRVVIVAFAVDLCIVFQQKFADLTLGGEVFEAFVAMRAFVAVW